MAKKEAKEMSVEQKLQALYELQTTLTAIDEKRALRGELPQVSTPVSRKSTQKSRSFSRLSR